MNSLSPQTQQLLKHLPALCNMARRLAVKAGDHTLPYFETVGEDGGTERQIKADGSPFTVADTEAEDIILAGLREMTPDIPVVGEESVSAGRIPDLNGAEWFWLVDPIDGTKEFLLGPNGSGEYTVNIALIHKGAPVLGVVYAPVAGQLYAGCGPGTAIRWRVDQGKDKPIAVRDTPAAGFTVVTSRNHHNEEKLNGFLTELKVAKVLHRASSLKICAIAEGKADIYPRHGLTSEWDTAAGHAILASAGGSIVDLDGHSLTYGHAGRKFHNPEFVASSGFWPLPAAPG
ncbi:MAG TPA: 3'(2'),5'-bisphosphate nucleotidase CysQ [Alphaproteobacteria bacterium]|jgi:3'(2'), 5'-bisphosphate nucleotidase